MFKARKIFALSLVFTLKTSPLYSADERMMPSKWDIGKTFAFTCKVVDSRNQRQFEISGQMTLTKELAENTMAVILSNVRLLSSIEVVTQIKSRLLYSFATAVLDDEEYFDGGIYTHATPTYPSNIQSIQFDLLSSPEISKARAIIDLKSGKDQMISGTSQCSFKSFEQTNL